MADFDNEAMSYEDSKTLVLETFLRYQENKTLKKQRISKDVQRAIKVAFDSDDDEFKEMASLLVYEVVERFYMSIAKQYIGSSETEFNDFQSELYLIISENLHKYNGENSLFTFLEPFVKRSFMGVKDKIRGVKTTRYFRSLGPHIKEALEEMGKMGLLEPTSIDISDYIKFYKKVNVPPETIERWFLLEKQSRPLDDSVLHGLKDFNNNNNPEEVIIERETSQEFNEMLSNLSDMSREILAFELNYLEDKKELPDVKLMYHEFLKKDPSLKKTSFELYVNSAHNDFRKIMSNKKEKVFKLPLNNMDMMDAVFKSDIEEDINIVESIKNGDLFLDV